MKTLFSRYDNWLTRSAPPHVLAIFRIGLGAFLLFYAGLYAPNIKIIFTNAGISLPRYVDRMPESWSWLLSLPSVSTAWMLYALLLLSLLCFTLGIFSRVSAFLTAMIGLYFWQLSLHLFPTSYNRIFFFMLLVLTFAQTDATFSLAQKIKTGSWSSWQPISVFAQRILALQIAITYLGVGIQKVYLPLWQGGEVLWYSFATRWGTWLAYEVLQWDLPMEVYDALVWIVILFECTLPFALWSKTYRMPYMAGTALFHGSITIFLGIWWFLVLIPANILFFEPEEVLGYLKKKCGLKT